MKVELWYGDSGYEFHIEPETEIEKCAFHYLADRPPHTVFITITRLGVFKMTKEEGE